MPELNCKNRSVFIGDNREVMHNLNAEIADAIITDPPFNSEQTLEDAQRKSVKKTHRRDYPVDEHGKPTRGFDDKWSITDLKRAEINFLKYKDEELLAFTDLVGRTHSTGMEAFLMMMAVRLLLCHKLLKETGSIFLHCNESANNYLRTIMDMIFGRNNFRNEIAWCYTGPSAAQKQFPRKHETIFWYSKSDKWTFNADAVRVPYTQLNTQHKEPGGGGIGGNLTKETVGAYRERGKIPESWWTKFTPVGRLEKERCNKPTQKPVALYSRLVLASTNPGDVVIDPFCGCATTLIAAENAGRQWIGIDINPTTEELVIKQLDKLSEGTEDFWRKEVTIRHGLPKRTDNKISKKKKDELKEQLMVEQLKHQPYLVCAICNHPTEHFYLEIGHEQPKCEDGGWEPDNLQLECSRCNRRKGSTKSSDDVRRELKAEGLMYEQRLDVHAHLKTLSQYQKDWKKGIKQRKKPRWKEDLEREQESRQPEIGL